MMNVAENRWLTSTALLTFVSIVFASSIYGSFQFDDWEVIVADSRVQTLQAWWDSMPGIRALLKLSYAINHQLGAGPVGFRVTNIALHGMNAVLLFAVLRRLGDKMLANKPAAAGLAAVMAAVAFAAHPVQTESVTYINGRSNVLMATFALATLYAWLRAGDEYGRRRLACTAASLIAMLLAVASKETALVMPLALWICWSCLPPAAHQRLQRPWPQTLLAVVLGVAALVWLPYRYFLDVSLATRSVADNLAAQAHGIWYLVGQLWHFERLNADPALPAITGLTAATVSRALALGGVIAFGFASLRKRPAVAFGILWFFVWVGPTNSLIARLDVVNDRQLYLAIIGPAWLLGLTVAALLNGRDRRWLTAAVVLLGSTLAVGTIMRNRVYANEVVFWEDAVKKSPHNSRAANNLGMAYALDCQPQAALRAFREAERISPGNYRAEINRKLLESGGLPAVPPRCKTQLPAR